MWMKITKHNLKLTHNNTRTNPAEVTRETFEGDFEHAKTLIMLQDHAFTGIAAMYIMDMSTNPTGDVKIYQINVNHKQELQFNPIAFHDHALTRIGKTAATRAQLNIQAMNLPHKDGRAIEKLLETIRVT